MVATALPTDLGHRRTARSAGHRAREQVGRIVPDSPALLPLAAASSLISVATVWLFVLFGRNMWATLMDVDTALELQEAVQRGMAGVFVVLLGMELLQTVKTYVGNHHFRLEVVLVVGAIAIARHIIQLDFHDVTGSFLGGLGVLIMSLVLGFYLLRRVPQAEQEDAG